MKRSILKFETCIMKGHTNTFRTIIKTQHGRVLFLLVQINGDGCTILDCFYIDRNQSKNGLDRYSAKPLKLRTFQCKTDNLLSVIEAELDKKFYGVEFLGLIRLNIRQMSISNSKLKVNAKNIIFLLWLEMVKNMMDCRCIYVHV